MDQQVSTASNEPSRARHAQVVPSFVLALLRRPLDSWVGQVSPGELLRWERAGDLTESARRDLRQTIVKRNRQQAERLWSRQVGVRLAENWQAALLPSDRKRVESLVTMCGERPLVELTLREVKEALKLPLEHTLAILARLEAVYWVPPAQAQEQYAPSAINQCPRCSVTPEMRALAYEVLQLRWLKTVNPQDVRFPYPSEVALPDWIRAQMDQSTVLVEVPDLLKRLAAADKLTAAEEAQAIAEAVGTLCVPRSNPEAAPRWVAILLSRHISPQGDGRTLIEVGNANGVTRERIRQICEAFEDVFIESDIATPALDKSLAATSRIAPCSVDEVNEQLARFIGEGAGIESLLHWTSVLGRDDVKVICHRTRTRVRGQLVDIKMVERAETAPWMTAMIRLVSRDCSMFGCTNILRVAGLLALRKNATPGQEAMENALEGAAGFRWLDRETGWFALGDSSGCSAASRVRKMMAVAHDHLGTDEITAALASDDMWMYRETQSLGLATPPVHVLRELFRGWPWLRVVQKGRFAPADSFDATRVLSDVEQLGVKVITDHDGVACRFELKEALIGQLNVSDVLVSVMLGSSPIFERVEHGLYRLIGQRVGDGAVNSARIRLRERNSHPLPVMEGAKLNEFGARVTEAAMRNEQYHVPMRFKKRLFGQRVVVRDADDNVLGEARVGQAGTLAGLNRLFPAVKPGDVYRVEVLDESLRVCLCPDASTPTAEGDQLASNQD